MQPGTVADLDDVRVGRERISKLHVDEGLVKDLSRIEIPVQVARAFGGRRRVVHGIGNFNGTDPHQSCEHSLKTGNI